MKIAVIGAHGVVGSAFAEHFSFLGHTVLPVDVGTELTLEKAAAQADAICVFTLPIKEVGRLLREGARVMKPGGLLIHGTSVALPINGSPINPSDFTAQGLNFGHLHFHFRPEAPLRSTMRGLALSLILEGPQAEKWQGWLKGSFQPYAPVIERISSGREHDNITGISQLVHMVVAYLVAAVWSRQPPKMVLKGIHLGGPPCRFLARSILRTASAKKVVAEILLHHPRTLPILQYLEEAIYDLRRIIKEKQLEKIEKKLGRSRWVFDRERLAKEDSFAAQLIRLEGDLRACKLVFRFRPERNKTGLLQAVAGKINGCGVNMTSFFAYNNPDGGCTFLVGIEESSAAERVTQAVQALE